MDTLETLKKDITNLNLGNRKSGAAVYINNTDSQSSHSSSTSMMSYDNSMDIDLSLEKGLRGRSEPYLEIIEQPQKEFRFRYQSEMQGLHGAILSRRPNGSSKKSYPTVQLHNYTGRVTIRCTLATTGENKSVHAHRLVAKCPDKDAILDHSDEPHDIEIDGADGTAEFANLLIIHIKKNNLVEVLERKMKSLIQSEYLKPQEFTGLTNSQINKMIVEKAINEAQVINMDQASLKFEALINCNGQLKSICPPVYSEPINNLKSHKTGKLKICRIDKFYISCRGNEEVFIFVDKVSKDNIKIQFVEYDNEGNIAWADFATFKDCDVHHQYAIAFWTPPYRKQFIEENIQVRVRLLRPSDNSVSNEIEMEYKAEKGGSSKKRRLSGSENLPYNPNLIARRENKSLFNVVSYDQQDIFIPVPEMEDFNLLQEDETEETIYLQNNSTCAEEVLKNLPTPDSIELRNCVKDLNLDSTSIELLQKLSASKEDIELLARAAVQSDAVGSQEAFKGTSKNKILRSFVKYTSDYTKQLLEKKNKGEIKEEVFMGHIKFYYEYSLDTENNKLLHLLVNRDFWFNEFLAFLTQFKTHRNLADCVKDLINVENENKETPFHRAVRTGSLNAVNELIQTGLVNPNATDSSNRSPLHWAVLMSNDNGKFGVQILNSIIKHCSTLEVNKICDSGTALHLAVTMRKYRQIIIILLQHPDIDVNICAGTNRQSVLSYAIESLNEELVECLICECDRYDKTLNKTFTPYSSYTVDEWFDQIIADGDTERVAKARRIRYLLDEDSPMPDIDVKYEISTLEEKPKLEIEYPLVIKNPLEIKEPDVHVVSLDDEVKDVETPDSLSESDSSNDDDDDDDTDPVVGFYDEKTGYFDKVALKEFALMLEPDNKWEKLAIELGYKNMLHLFRKQPNPTIFMLDFIERYCPEEPDMKEFLLNIKQACKNCKLETAAKVVEKLLTRKSQSKAKD